MECNVAAVLPYREMSMHSEQVLVVPTACLWDRVKYSDRGLITEGADQLAAIVTKCGRFMNRAEAETDPRFKQVIPYAIVRHNNFYFLLQRKPAQSEQRLHHKFSIGVGGHINPPSDAMGFDVIREGLAKEVQEELHIHSSYSVRLIGLINDDTTEVGRVHLGVLFEINSPSSDVHVRETNKMHGAWALVERLQETYAKLETWSQIVFDSCLRNGTARAM